MLTIDSMSVRVSVDVALGEGFESSGFCLQVRRLTMLWCTRLSAVFANGNETGSPRRLSDPALIRKTAPKLRTH